MSRGDSEEFRIRRLQMICYNDRVALVFRDALFSQIAHDRSIFRAFVVLTQLHLPWIVDHFQLTACCL